MNQPQNNLVIVCVWGGGGEGGRGIGRRLVHNVLSYDGNRSIPPTSCMCPWALIQ